MSYTNCPCQCHANTIYDAGWCVMCVNNHQYQIYPRDQPAINTNVDYSSMTFAVIQEIKDLLTDIKKLLVENNNDRSPSTHRAKSRKANTKRRKS